MIRALLVGLLLLAPGVCLAKLPVANLPLWLQSVEHLPREVPRASGTLEFSGFAPCEFPYILNHDACNGSPGFSVPFGIQDISEGLCRGYQLQSLVFSGVRGTCQPQGLRWNYGGQCYPFVALGIDLFTCATAKYECDSRTFLGVHLHATCCAVAGGGCI